MDTKALRQKILDLAIRGKLVPQDPNDEPASVLLERIRAEKERLIAEGKIKRPKKPKTSSSESHYQNFTPPFPIPDSWQWVKLEDIITIRSGENIVVRNLKDSDIFPVYGGNGINGYYEKANVEVDTLIIGRVGFYCGSIHRTKSKAWITDNALIVTTFANHLNIDWLQMALMWANIRDTSNSTAQPVVSGKSIYPIVVPLPPLEEQVQIANKFKSFEVCISQLSQEIDDLIDYVNTTKSKILELAMQGKLVPQDPTDEPAADMLRRVNPKARIITDNPHYPQLPSNWVYVSLEDIVDYDQPQPFIVNDTNYSEEYSTPVLTAGKSFILGYTNEDFGIYNKLPAIIFDDFTTDSHLVDFPFKVKSSAMKILTVKEGINVEFVSYFMSITRLFGDTHKRYWISEYSKLSIPLPPIAEQNRIVSAVRKFNNQIKSIQYILN